MLPSFAVEFIAIKLRKKGFGKRKRQCSKSHTQIIA